MSKQNAYEKEVDLFLSSGLVHAIRNGRRWSGRWEDVTPKILLDAATESDLPELPVVSGREMVLMPGIIGYAISNSGMLLTCRKNTSLGHGNGSRASVGDKWTLMRLAKDKDGYRQGGVRQLKRKLTVIVHRYVLTLFRCPRPDGLFACHNDGDKDNNHISNLRWDTRSANEADKVSHGTDSLGSRNPCAILDELKVAEILQRNRDGSGVLASEYGVSVSTINMIRQKKIWRHVTAS